MVKVPLHQLLHRGLEVRHTKGQRQEEVHEDEDDRLQVGDKHKIGVISEDKDLEEVFNTVVKDLLRDGSSFLF